MQQFRGISIKDDYSIAERGMIQEFQQQANKMNDENNEEETIYRPSKLDHTFLNSEVDIDGYTLFRCDRTRNGGGVIMYVNNRVGVKERIDFSKDIEMFL